MNTSYKPSDVIEHHGNDNKLSVDITNGAGDTLKIWYYCAQYTRAGLVHVQTCPKSLMDWARAAAKHYVSTGGIHQVGDVRLYK